MPGKSAAKARRKAKNGGSAPSGTKSSAVPAGSSFNAPSRHRPAIKRNTLSRQSGLTLPVARLRTALKRSRTTKLKRISVQSAVYLTAVIEYLVAELLELSGNMATQHKRRRIIPRHIRLAVGHDSELHELCKAAVFAEGGAIEFVHPALLVKAGKKKVTYAAVESDAHDLDNAQ